VKKVVFFFIIVLHLCATVSKADTGKCKCTIKPEVGIPGDIITIQGDFGEKQEDSYMILSDMRTDRIKIVCWEKDKVKFMVPPRLYRAIVNVELYINGTRKCTADMKFGLYASRIDLVNEAIKLRKIRMQESTIIDHLDHISRSSTDGSPDRKGRFGNYRLTGSQITKLREEGFQDDFIAKFEGHPQHVSVGIAPLWLLKTKDLVYAPMIRILLTPRSYFYERSPYISWPWFGLWQIERWDLNFGYTTKTSTEESNDIGEEKNYALIGFSNQLNRSAFLNIGWALVPGDIEGVETQYYFGFTVDYNVLKGIGVVSK
jgi:hypothetical protein